MFSSSYKVENRKNSPSCSDLDHHLDIIFFWTPLNFLISVDQIFFLTVEVLTASIISSISLLLLGYLSDALGARDHVCLAADAGVVGHGKEVAAG